MKAKYMVGALVAAGAFFIWQKKSSAARNGGESVEADTDRIVDGIPGAPPARAVGTQQRGGVLQPVVKATGQTASAIASGVEALASAAGRFFGQGTAAAPLGGGGR